MADSVAIINPGGSSSGGSPTYNPPNCIIGTGTDGVTGSTPHVQFDNYYVAAVNLGAYAAIAYIVRPDNDGNLTSGSIGALHPWLIQTPTTQPGSTKFFRLQGNFVLSDGSSTPTFSTSIFPGLVGSWYHLARQIALDGGSALTVRDYVNGACFMRYKAATAASGKNSRATAGVGTGGGMLGLFGTDHQGGAAHVAQFGVYEGGCFFSANNPQNSSPPAFIPKRSLAGNFGGTDATLLVDFSGERAVYPDMSSGWTKGSGTRYYQNPATLGNSVAGQPLPVRVYDPTCPVTKDGDLTFAAVSAVAPNYIPADRGIPAGTSLLAYDDFRRPVDGSRGSIGPQDYFLQPKSGPDLGKCHPLSPYAGAQQWRQRMLGGAAFSVPVSGRAWGIFYGYDPNAGGHGEIALAKPFEGQCIVTDQNVGTADHFVYAERSNSIDGATGVLARIGDASNFLACFNTDSSTIFIFDYQSGGNVAGFGWSATPTNTAWRKLALSCKGTVIKGYVDSASGVTLAGIDGKWELLAWSGQAGSPTTYTDSVHGSATYCGFGNTGGAGVAADPIFDAVEWAAFTTP